MSKILLVDNSKFAKMILRNLLNKYGYKEVYECDSGEQAINIFEEINPELVILDIVMDGMDGLETLKKLRDKFSNSKIVMCSAYGQRSSIVEAIQSGASDFIVKPFTESRVIEVVNRCLNK